MDILVLTWNYPPRRGGIENLMGSLCEELRKKHAVHVTTAHASDSTADENGIHRAPWPGLLAFAVYALWRGAIILARDREIRVVFGGSALVTPLVLILARVFRRRVVVLTHGLDVVHQNFFYQLLCVRWLKFCDRVVANSHYTASLAEQKGARPERVWVIPPGVDLGRFISIAAIEHTKREWGLEGKRIILFVGRLARRKGVKEFIQGSLPRVVQEIPDVCFVIAGGNPTESLTHRDDVRSEITTVIAEMDLEQHARVLGGVHDDDLVKLYHASDVVILPAIPTEDDVEGFGIVLLEAAAAGKPVVATRVGGIPDAVEDGKSGLLIDADDYNELSRSIIDLVADEKKRWGMGEYARSRVGETFSWEKILERYESVFSETVARMINR